MRWLALLAVLLSAPAAAAGERLAVVVGANLGGADDPPLRFAERDATRVAETLADVGGVARADLALLNGASAAEVRAALAAASRRAALSAASHGAAGATLLFYYSGHAGMDGLHVRGEVIAWDELRALTSEAKAGAGDLRIVLVDACHAGELARAKGFVAVQPGEGAENTAEHSQGSAVLAAAEWFEAAQESDALGGSFFTHALVSGLRGAADADGDGLVTLAELEAYVSRDTAARTAQTTGLAQHPTYRFDIAGRGDVVLARLRDADARVVLDDALAGTVVVLERDSPFVVVEAPKRAGQKLAFALPRGRYVVYVRAAASVGVAEVTLPWGGEVRLAARDLSARSYQEVALKGGLVDVRRTWMAFGATLETAPLDGMGLVPGAALTVSHSFDRLELGLRAAGGRKGFDAVDTSITASYLGGGAFLGVQWPERLFDLRAWAAADVARWWESVDGAADRGGWVPALGVGGGARVPLTGRTFLSLGIEARALFPDVQGDGRTARASLRGDVLFGFVL